MRLSALVRRMLPGRLGSAVLESRVARRERSLRQLSLADAFDKVYRQGMWKQGRALSGLGSEGVLAERYATFVRDYAARHALRTVFDGGTGDFSVGSRLAPNFGRYTAADVSPYIVEMNRSRFHGSKWGNVHFMVADLTESEFPAADLVLIRQVLQHLPNSKIEMILRNLEASSWRRALICEDVHNPADNDVPNLDLPAHTVRTRRSMGSGVFLDRHPFNRSVSRVATIYPSEDGSPQAGGLLVFEYSRET